MHRPTVLVLLLSLLALRAFAQDSVTIGSHRAPSVQALPTRSPIHIDGRLDEPEWSQAVPATRFTQTDPQEGLPATESTEVRVLVSSNAIYIGARLFDRDPSGIRAPLARRDEEVQSDQLEILIDAYHDHLSAVSFRINPAGAIRDAILGSASQGGSDDVSWDPVWDYTARVDSLGWTAELRIPLSQLHYTSQDNATWGIQFHRTIFRKGEQDYFAFTPKRESAGVNRYGHLTGLGRVESQRQLEILPYATARAEFTHPPSGDPFRDGSDMFGSAGVDLKYGITSDITLNATVNPDFGQVEVDPAVVNLSAFETFFPEKRPFFVEGADVFRFGGIRAFNSFGFPRFFFSRRIGRQPQGFVTDPQATFVDQPNQTSIRAAAKLSGRTSSGWSLGFLDAVTAAEDARFVAGGGVRHTSAVEPLTNYLVSRVRKDLLDGNLTVGLIGTAVNRSMDDPSLKDLLRSQAYLGGFDFNYSWNHRNWSLDGAIATSQVEGSPGAILRTQLSSARYYQRPDAKSFSVDPTRTSLGGHAFQVSLARNAGVHWLSSVVYQETSPGFEANDLGFETSADRRAFSTALIYQENTPGKLFRNFSIYPFTNHTWDFDGDLLFGSFGMISTITLKNFWSLFLRGDLAPPAYDNQLTRGGPIARSPASRDLSAQVATDSRWTTQASASVYHYRDAGGSKQTQYNFDLSFHPAAAARISIGPAITETRQSAQYVQTVTDPAGASTFGARYVFGRLDQTEVSLITRLNWTFTPRLSLQLFLQPLISTGDYSHFKELKAPRTFGFVEYGKDRGSITPVAAGDSVSPGDGGSPFSIGFQDFNFRSLRANAVLRWEWRPGSTLFLVWQQSRENVAGVGDFKLRRDLNALFDAKGDNILAVKVTYWFGL
ncbi:MAG: DUF5916 domain-containing protein [Gemmatimonadota bacterium]